MKYILYIFLIFISFNGCMKMKEKEQQPQINNVQQITINDSEKVLANRKNLDSLSLKLSEEAYNFEVTYKKNSTDRNKEQLIEKHLKAGQSYLPTDKLKMNSKNFRTALKHFKRVLELDPNNQEALEGKIIIEDMYKVIGKEPPKD